jgi:hypothetical protein
MVLAAVHRFLTVPRPASVLLFGSLIFSTSYCLYLFDINFLDGTSDFWMNSRGIRGIISADISTALSGYFFFVHDAWQLPLFHVSKLGIPEGTNIIFTDSIPLLALIGRIIYRLTGETVNVFGAWTAACYILTAVALTRLVTIIGERTIVATAAAALIGVSIPPLLWRWGNPALMAHFEIVLSFVFYFQCKERCTPLSCIGTAILLTAMALTTNPYIFLMVEGIVAATIAQVLIDRVLSLRAGGFVVVGLGAFTVLMMVLCGHLEARGVSEIGFGFYSMNALSPIFPQLSGVFSGLSSFILDGSGGQYEGFNYLGAGILLLVAASLVPPGHSSGPAIIWWYKGLRASCAHHPCLFAVLAGFAILSLSNSVFVGPWLILQIPVPSRVLELLGIFRSSGRLFWPVVYCVAAVALVRVMARYRRSAPALLLSAAMLQWVDAAPLKTAVAASAATPVPPVIEASAWRQAISRHSVLWILPPFACLGRPDEWGSSQQIEIQLQLLAAIEDVAVNSVYAGRKQTDCAPEPRPITGPVVKPGELYIYLPESGSLEMAGEIPAKGDLHCRSSHRLAICSQDLSHLDVPSLLDVRRAEWQQRK